MENSLSINVFCLFSPALTSPRTRAAENAMQTVDKVTDRHNNEVYHYICKNTGNNNKKLSYSIHNMHYVIVLLQMQQLYLLLPREAFSRSKYLNYRYKEVIGLKR